MAQACTASQVIFVFSLAQGASVQEHNLETAEEVALGSWRGTVLSPTSMSRAPEQLTFRHLSPSAKLPVPNSWRLLEAERRRRE